MQPRGPLEILHLVEERTQGKCTGQFNSHQSSKGRTIGCTGDGTWSPPPLGCVEGGEVSGMTGEQATFCLDSQKCALCSQGGCRSMSEQWEQSGHHCSHTLPPNNQGSISGKGSLVSLSVCHKSTPQSSATFFSAERCVGVGRGNVGVAQGRQGKDA